MTAEHTHRWARTGVYIDGQACFPCLRHGCTTGLARVLNGAVLQAGRFPDEVAGVPLDIEDDPDGGVAKMLFWEVVGAYRLHELTLTPGDVVLDVGAHVGVVTCYLAKRCSGVRIYAFEPVEANFARLCRNLAVNGVAGSVTPKQAAITADGRDVRLTVNPGENSGGASLLLPPAVGAQSVVARSYAFRHVFAQCVPDRCALLKLDCEGAEYEILRSAPELLDRVDRVVAEFHYTARRADAEALAALVHRYVPPERTQITYCPIGR